MTFSFHTLGQHLLLFACWVSLYAVSACTLSQPTPTVSQGDTISLRHAQLFTLIEHDSYTQVVVHDAWNKGKVLQQYVLLPRGQEPPKELPEGVVVTVPLQRAVVFTSVHASLLRRCGAMHQIVGMCDQEYVVDSLLQAAIRGGAVEDMGSSIKPNVEKIVATKSDALLVSPFQNSHYGALEKTGIPLIECADYMEETPLGRAEWLRLYGRLFGFTEKADSLFSVVERQYLHLATQVKQVRTRPKLLVDKRENGTWFVPGGKSVPAQLFRDAGFNYIFANNTERGSVAKSLEQVLQAGEQANFWLIKYGAAQDLTLRSLQVDDSRYARFRSWQQHKVYGCNTFRQPYYETASFQPHLLLEELIHIAHPDLLKTPPQHSSAYYRLLSHGN